MKETIASIEEMEAFARKFLKGISGPARESSTLVALSGDLGAGKTAFAKAIAKTLGVVEEVTSPTFVLEKIYRLSEGAHWNHFIHIDAYRLESGRELLSLGFDDICRDPGNLILLEWPEKVASALEGKTPVGLSFKHVSEMVREISST